MGDWVLVLYILVQGFHLFHLVLYPKSKISNKPRMCHIDSTPCEFMWSLIRTRTYLRVPHISMSIYIKCKELYGKGLIR